MCKIKEYSDNMHSCLTSVLVRFDTYLLPNDINEIFGSLKNKLRAIPSEILFDDINEQIIDIDSVAVLHNVYLNNVLDSNGMFFLKDACHDGIGMDIYINKFFIAFNVQSNKHCIEDSIKSIESIESDILKEFGVLPEYCYIRLNYSKTEIKGADIWKLFDKSAFPVMEDRDYNGRYIDTISKKDIEVDLSRSISTSGEGNRMDINIQTKAIFRIENPNEISERIKDAILISKDEVSRCFAL